MLCDLRTIISRIRERSDFVGGSVQPLGEFGGWLSISIDPSGRIVPYVINGIIT